MSITRREMVIGREPSRMAAIAVRNRSADSAARGSGQFGRITANSSLRHSAPPSRLLRKLFAITRKPTLLQHPVALLVAKVIVEEFEIVDVDQQQGERLPITPRQDELPLQRALETPADSAGSSTRRWPPACAASGWPPPATPGGSGFVAAPHGLR